MNIVKKLLPLMEIGIDGCWSVINSDPDFSVTVLQEDILKLKLVNKSGRTVKFDGFRFTFDLSNCDLLGCDSHDLSYFRESWTAVAPVGSFRHGDCDFNYWDQYVVNVVADKKSYQAGVPNVFGGENMCMIKNLQNGNILLWGFVTSKDYMSAINCRFLGANGAKLVMTCMGDGIEFADQQELVSEEMLILSGDEPFEMMSYYAAVWGRKMNAISWDHTPSGWCSWYYYYFRITENDLLENIEFLKNNREKYPLEYFQIDDGYQSALGDWLVTNKAQFTHEMDFIAEKIKDAGLKPGIWLAPFLAEEKSALLREHPEWMLHDSDGNICMPVDWRGGKAAVLDTTRDDVCQFLENLFRTLHQQGWEYFKLDFMMYECSTPNCVYNDRTATRAQALRKGLEAIRRGAGDDSLILGGTMVMGPAVGVVNAERIGTDITPFWVREKAAKFDEASAVYRAIRNVLLRSYMHRNLWLNDPDVLIVRKERNELNEDEVMLWWKVLQIGGGMLLMTDRFCELDEEREALARKLLQNYDKYVAVPLNLFEKLYPDLFEIRDLNGNVVEKVFINFADNNVIFNNVEVRAHSFLSF